MKDDILFLKELLRDDMNSRAYSNAMHRLATEQGRETKSDIYRSAELYLGGPNQTAKNVLAEIKEDEEAPTKEKSGMVIDAESSPVSSSGEEISSK